MALIKCPECRGDLSDKALSCPHCGFTKNHFENIEMSQNSINVLSDKHNARETHCIDGITYVCNVNDFEITNGVLTKYTGSDERILVPSGVTKIGESAFCGAYFEECADKPGRADDKFITNCYYITHIYICDGVETIGKSAFANCENLESIMIPDSVTTIESGAFLECKKLPQITIPEGVSSIEFSTFNGCNSLESVVLPDSITKIGGKAFCSCLQLKKIRIPKKLTELGANAFWYCTDLEDITIPTGITKIQEGTFYYCINLKKIDIPDGVISIHSGPSFLAEMGRPHYWDGAFNRCIRLEHVRIPNSVTEIEKDVFKDSPLVVIVASLDSFAHKYAKQYGIKFQEDENSKKERLEKERRRQEQLKRERAEKEQQLKESSYQKAINLKNAAKTDKDYSGVIAILNSIKDYKDSKDIIDDCNSKIKTYRTTRGLCLHCGGKFKGLFSKKCSSCKQPKNY